MQFFKDFPIYEIIISKETDGINLVSLVDDPAVESYFQKFKKEKEEQKIKCSIIDKEERRVIAPIVRCNFPIFRLDEYGRGYYITFSKEVVREIARKMLHDNRQNVFNINHEDGNYTTGLEIEELLIKNSDKGISPKGYEDIEEGSLFGVYLVKDNDIWNKIQDGTFNGLSLEGYFSYQEVKKDDVLNTIEDLVNYLSH